MKKRKINENCVDVSPFHSIAKLLIYSVRQNPLVTLTNVIKKKNSLKIKKNKKFLIPAIKTDTNIAKDVYGTSVIFIMSS